MYYLQTCGFITLNVLDRVVGQIPIIPFVTCWLADTVSLFPHSLIQLFDITRRQKTHLSSVTDCLYHEVRLAGYPDKF